MKHAKSSEAGLKHAKADPRVAPPIPKVLSECGVSLLASPLELVTKGFGSENSSTWKWQKVLVVTIERLVVTKGLVGRIQAPGSDKEFW